ncbi:hypothetical protein CEUSTIGMA_g3410.t1 [Chlamydomonas eustigma]|uniref:Uncharacterized protein n=1 Tax=Chlamydomonas eustigma TaxID=1157962 RepID=A0A250WYP9_9CHLO|nr:hypothetical protein CEUSTIGMA_g3410.t1 [Chlamydomonas eustigma]|eukprot:GAX75967.1 hypothetical protein CEUSTIGMA_g3410.t1 [Chlamydomonas eustigma]
MLSSKVRDIDYLEVYTTSTSSSAISIRLASSQSIPEASESNITVSFNVSQSNQIMKMIEPALPETLETLLLDPISNKSQQHHHASKHELKSELQVGEASHSGGNIPLLVAMSPVSSSSGRPLAPTPTAAAAQQDHPFSGGASSIKPRFNFINLTAQPDQPTSSKAVQSGTAAAPRSYLSFRPSTSAPSPSSGEGYGMKRVYSDHAVDEFPLPPPSAPPLSGSRRTGRRFSAVSIPASAMHHRL